MFLNCCFLQAQQVWTPRQFWKPEQRTLFLSCVCLTLQWNLLKWQSWRQTKRKRTGSCPSVESCEVGCFSVKAHKYFSVGWAITRCFRWMQQKQETRLPYAFRPMWNEFPVWILCTPQPEGVCFPQRGIFRIICDYGEAFVCVCLFYHLTLKCVFKDFVRAILSV